MLFSAQIWGQGSCGMPDPPSYLRGGFSDCIDMDIDEVPVKTVRITIHVFQKDDGSENIPDNSTGRGWLLNSLFGNVNYRMANLAMMNLSTSSPYFSDSKIQYEVANIYFWQNTNLCSKGNRFNGSHGQAMYDYVMTQNIAHKSTSLHLMIPGNYGSIGMGGRACGSVPGCTDWAMLEDTYDYYQNNSPWLAAGTVRHEFGHNFNLWHSWYNEDYCSDTPPNSNCWSGPNCSNNVMDSNAHEAALTQCQLSRMHESIENHSNLVISGMPNYAISGQISWTGGNKALDNLNFLPDPEFEVNINAPGSSYYTWTKTYGNGTWSTNGSGSVANIEIDPSDDHMTFEVSTEANCHDLTDSYSFYHFPTLYKVYPNPIGDIVTIELDKSVYRQLQELQKGSSFNHSHGLKILDQYNVLMKEKVLKSDFGSFTVNVSGYKPGLYIIELRNNYFSKRFKVQKL